MWPMQPDQSGYKNPLHSLGSIHNLQIGQLRLSKKKYYVNKYEAKVSQMQMEVPRCFDSLMLAHSVKQD